MFKRLHLGLLPILLISLVFFTYWLDQSVQPINFTLDDDRSPDYIVENLSGVRVNYEREVQRTFFADRMFHYMDEDVTQLEQPRFFNREPNKPLIRLHADQAEMDGNGEDVFLTGNVTVLRGLDNDDDLLTMMTNYLHLIPDQNRVQTDQSVTISRLNTTINAIGFELDNNVGRIQLLSRVRAMDVDGKLTK